MEKENRINIEDLPQAEREVSPEESKEVQGGEYVIVMKDCLVSSWQTSPTDGGSLPSQPVKGGDDILIGGSTSFGHVK